MFLDDVSVTADGAIVAETSFETDLGGWTVAGPPEGSAPNPNDWARSQLAYEEGAVTATTDTIYTGFGLEGLTAEKRADFVTRSMQHLLGGSPPSTRQPFPSIGASWSIGVAGSVAASGPSRPDAARPGEPLPLLRPNQALPGRWIRCHCLSRQPIGLALDVLLCLFHADA